MQTMQQILKSNPPSNCSGMPVKMVQTTSISTSKRTAAQRTSEETSSNSKAVALPDKVVETLFLRFTTRYGHAWSSLHKEGEFIGSFKREWAEALGGFNTQIIKEALLYCRTHYRLPPNIPEFFECCKMFKERKCSTTAPRPDTKPRDLEKGRQQLKKIKQLLNMK